MSLLFLILSLCATSIAEYKVLIVFPMASKSHDVLGRSIVREMLMKGNDVTYITAFPRDESIKNLREIDVSYILPQTETVTDHVTAALNGSHYSGSLSTGMGLMKEMVAKLLQHNTMRLFLLDTSNQFDVVVVEWFNNEVLAGLSEIFQCPLVWYSSLDVHGTILRLVDDAVNPSYSPQIFSQDVPPLDFLQRATALWDLLEDLYYTDVYRPSDRELYERAFSEAARAREISLPDYEEVVYNASLLLVNSHPSLGSAVRLPRNVQCVGGHHVTPVRPLLPENIQAIMDNSEQGVIYINFGSFLKNSPKSEQLKTYLLRMLGGLEQTVLWRYDEQLDNAPTNVHIFDWIPQAAVLEHPNTKLFITHGGLLSTTEAVHFGVPIIGVPLFGDQFINMARSEKKGFALTVHFTWDLVADLKNAIELALGDSTYAETARSLSKLYHLRPQPPGEELAYWIEYVITTKGAPHLRSPALMLPWYQRFYVDLAVLVLISVWALFWVIRFIFRFLCDLCSSKEKDE